MIRLISIRKITLLKVCLTLFACFTTFSSFAQQYNFEYFTLENGLPQATIFCMFQDSRGYIWLGTEGSGACRFDGKNFTVINQTNGLAGGVVRNILEDNKGRLWFGTEAGVSVYDGNKFITINEQKGLSSNTVVCLYQDKSGAIWAGTAGDKGGLNNIELLPGDSIKIKKFTADNGLSNNSVFTLCEDNFNRLWIGSFGGGINVMSKNDKMSHVSFTKLNNFPSNHILTISPDSINNVWIGTYDKGIIKISVTNDLNLSRIEQFSNAFRITDNTIWTILPAPNDVLFGTNESGILRFMNQKITSINNSNGLLKNQVISIFKDREENIGYHVVMEAFAGFWVTGFITSLKRKALQMKMSIQ